MTLLPDRISLWRIFAVLVAILAVVLACQNADAQVFMVRTDIKACRVVYCETEIGTGSSVCIGHIGDRYYFLTAGHCCYSTTPGVVNSKLQQAYIAIDKQWVPCHVDGFDRKSSETDIAIFSLVPGKSLHELPLAERTPVEGTQVVIGGFPSGSPYAEVKANIRSKNSSASSVLLSTAVVHGVSGGPVMHNGEVVGIVSASDFSDTTAITGVEQIRGRLTSWLGRLPDCGKPRPTVPPQPEKAEKEPERYEREEKSLPLAPPSEAPDLSVAASGVASSAWTYLWPALAGALGLSGPVGIGVYMAGRLIASRLGPKVVERVQERIHDRQQTSQPQAPQPLPEGRVQYVPVQVPVEKQTEVPVPVHVSVPTTQNRFVDVPVMNSEAEALKEAMRLEAEFTRTDNPVVSQHLRRVQEMADMILKGHKIEKPGWKL